MVELWLLLGKGGSGREQLREQLLQAATRSSELAMGLALRQLDAWLDRAMQSVVWPHLQWMLVQTRRLPRLL